MGITISAESVIRCYIQNANYNQCKVSNSLLQAKIRITINAESIIRYHSQNANYNQCKVSKFATTAKMRIMYNWFDLLDVKNSGLINEIAIE